MSSNPGKALSAACVGLLFFATMASAAQTKRLRRMVVIGDSILAGYGSGGFVANGKPGQNQSAPSVIARKARVSLPQPLMDGPGVPPQLRIVDANRNGVLDPGEVRRPDGLGFRARPGKTVRNLAVPGEDIDSVNDSISSASIAESLVTGGNVDGREILKFLVLGLPLREDSVSQISRARQLSPSFLLVWIGNNDVLPMATRTDPAAVRLAPAAFGNRFRTMLDQLADTGAGMAVSNLPDVTGIAALRRAAGDVTQCRTLAGGLQSVAADDLLPLDLDRASLPNPPCTKVLDATERAQIRTTVQAFNAEIAAAIADLETRRGIRIAAVDMFAGFDTLAAGVDANGDGTIDLTTRYLGGLFSLDGIHPTRTANAYIANAFIDAINLRFGDTIPRVDIATVAGRDPLAKNRFRPAGEAPFGLFAEPEDQVEATFERAFDRIENRADDIGDELRDTFEDIF